MANFWQHANAAAAQYSAGAWLFLRALGIIYGIAFLSLAIQIKGLAGRKGILSAGEFLTEVEEQFGRKRFSALPTLFWLNSSDSFLQAVCWTGIGLSALLIAGVAPVAVLILLWASYLSLFSVMRLFLGYQWDILLLEVGFLAIFLAPLQLLPTRAIEEPPWPILLLLYWLLFRLMFLSGLAKWRSRDVTWRRLTGLAHHYETQPLPTPPACFAHQLPLWFHKGSTVLMLLIELAVPFLIFAPPPYRQFAGLLIIGLMLLIMLTGNYCFFNLLAIAL
ncbi:MAG TPA: lipase maturation factor family protein, partial [Candidatus Binatia bacterium]|nr:lipase maturation factor family protein [Candidatus Binatia bacterium]